VNILIATFLQNFLETHNGWYHSGPRSPISGGEAVFAKKSFFSKIGRFCRLLRGSGAFEAAKA
jgi:hypothetical protein